MNNAEDVLKHYDKFRDLPVYKLYWGDKPTGQQADQSKEGSTHAESMEQLRNTLMMLSPGRYCVQFKRTEDASKGVITAHFTLPYTAGAGAAIGSTGNHGIMGNGQFIPATQLDQIISAKIGEVSAQYEKKMLEERMQRMQDDFNRKLEELKQEKANPITDLLSSDLGKGIGAMLLSRFMPGGGTPGVAGPQQGAAIYTTVNENHKEQETITHNQNPQEMDDNQKLIWAINKMSANTGGNSQTVDLLCRMAQWMDDNKSGMTYNILLGELQKVQPKFENTPGTEQPEA